MAVPRKKGVKLSSNFFHAVAEAEALTGGRAILVNERSGFALVKIDNDLRLLISED